MIINIIFIIIGFIYIPIWLDLLYKKLDYQNIKKKDLHSNMVRFIMKKTCLKYQKRLKIYIPIWLDLLFGLRNLWTAMLIRFTFQYG